MIRRTWLAAVVGSLFGESTDEEDIRAKLLEFDTEWYTWYRKYAGCQGHLCYASRGMWDMEGWNKLKGLAKKLWKD
jgi:hypothetical protein